MAGVGSACLVVALLTALYAVGASVYGARSRRREWISSGRRAIYCVAALSVTAFALLEAAFLRSDFSYALVAEGSSTDTPTFYKVTALWATQDGSLLLWVTLLSLFSTTVLFLTRRSLRDIAPYATAVLGVIAAFFLLLMVGWENPFDTLAMPPAEGAGLNPLLRHPAMMIHPPMLYTGYVGFSIPFAFAIGALIARRTGADWIRATRRFALIAWTFLGTGIMLGALWSYTELGWGGYWAWDPVENASLMPWLVGTAFLHSIMVQEKRGMLKVWNVSLICATFTLALMGTFLVRSGILESIHAFGASTIGVQFLVFIGLVIAVSAGLIIARLPVPALGGAARLAALARGLLPAEQPRARGALPRDPLGHVLPARSPRRSPAPRRASGRPGSTGWSRRWRWCSCCSTAIGPMLAWRRFTPSSLRRILAVPLAVVAVALVVLLALTDAADSPPSLAMFCLVAFVLAAVGQELWRGTVARRTMTGESWPRALARLIGRNRRRYGGFLVHAGIAVLFLGVAASSAFLDQRDVRLSPGDSFRGERLRGDLPRGHGQARRRLGRHRRADLLRRRARRAQGRQALRAAAVAQLLPERRPLARHRSRASSRARPPARSTSAGASRATSGWRCGPDIGSLEGPIARGGRQVRRLARRRAGADRGRARRELPQRPAAGGVPRHRVAARGVDLDRRGDRGARRAGRGLAVAGGAAAPGRARSTRPAWAESSRARRRRWSTRSPWSCSPRSWLRSCACRCAGAGRRSAARRRCSPS